jgi:hypothetical protein
VLLGASTEAKLHQHLKDIAMGDEFSDFDLDTPSEADLDLAYGSRYLGTTDLGDRKVRTRIQKIKKEDLTGNDGRKKMKFIIFFETLDKALVLNNTNKDALVDKLGRVPGGWIGASVGLFVDPNVSFGGKRTGGVRLRVLEPVKTAKAAKAPKPAATKPAAPANEWAEEAGDPGFEPDPNDSPDFDQAAE